MKIDIRMASDILLGIFRKHKPALDDLVAKMNQQPLNKGTSFVLDVVQQVYTHGPDNEPYVLQSTRVFFCVYEVKTTLQRFLWWRWQRQMKKSVIKLEVSLCVMGQDSWFQGSIECPEEMSSELTPLLNSLVKEARPLVEKTGWVS